MTFISENVLTAKGVRPLPVPFSQLASGTALRTQSNSCPSPQPVKEVYAQPPAGLQQHFMQPDYAENQLLPGCLGPPGPCWPAGAAQNASAVRMVGMRGGSCPLRRTVPTEAAKTPQASRHPRGTGAHGPPHGGRRSDNAPGVAAPRGCRGARPVPGRPAVHPAPASGRISTTDRHFPPFPCGQCRAPQRNACLPRHDKSDVAPCVRDPWHFRLARAWVVLYFAV